MQEGMPLYSLERWSVKWVPHEALLEEIGTLWRHPQKRMHTMREGKGREGDYRAVNILLIQIFVRTKRH